LYRRHLAGFRKRGSNLSDFKQQTKKRRQDARATKQSNAFAKLK